MKLKNGDRIRVIHNKYDHKYQFHVGDEGTVADVHKYPGIGDIIKVIFNERVDYWVWDNEVKQIK